MGWGHVIAGAVGGMGVLIFVYLLLAHGDASNSLLNTSVTGAGTLIKDLQGR